MRATEPPRDSAPTHSGLASLVARFEAWLDGHPWPVAIALYAIAVALRLVYLRDFETGRVARVPLMDEAYYVAEAWNLVRGAPPASDVYFMTPLYPWFLSLVFRLFGDGSVAPFAVQLVLGAFAAPLAHVVARHAIRPAIALASALAVASFAPLVFFEALFLVEGLVLLGVLGAVAAAIGIRRPLLAGALAGVALGIAVLGRGSNLALVLPLAGWFAWGGWRGERPGRRRALVAFLVGLAAVLGPLLARNVVRAGRPFLLTANAGFNFYVGNGPEATGIFVHVPGLDVQQDQLTLRYVQRRLHRPVTASETHDFWMDRTRTWVREHPGRTLRLFGWKLLLFWNRMSIPQVEGFESAAIGTSLDRSPFWRSFGFLPLALVGTVMALIALVRRARRGALDAVVRARGFLATVAVLYSVSIALFFVTDRYRVPILPILIVLAGCMVETIVRGFASGRRRWLPALALVVTTAFVLTDPRLLRVDLVRMQRDLHVHAALRAAAAQRFDDALHEYEIARRLDPTDSDVRDGMARMLGRAGRDSLAILEFRSLLHDDPENAGSWYNYGNLLRRLGRQREAFDAYERSIAIEPGREAAWNQRGEALRALGDTATAAASYRRALEIAPAYEQALNNLAAHRAALGDAAGAEAGWRAAIAANPRYLPALVNLAILLGDMGRREEALQRWRQAYAVAPENATVRRMLQELDPTAKLAPSRTKAAAPTDP